MSSPERSLLNLSDNIIRIPSAELIRHLYNSSTNSSILGPNPYNYISLLDLSLPELESSSGGNEIRSPI